LELEEERPVLRMKLAEVRHRSAVREAERAAREAGRAAERAQTRVAKSETRVAKSMDPKYYQHSNHYTIGGVVFSLLASGLVDFALAFGYSYSLLRLPFVQGNFLLTLLYGFFSGLATALFLCWRKVRSLEVAAFVGVASGLAAVYLSWVVWIYGYLGLFKKL